MYVHNKKGIYVLTKEITLNSFLQELCPVLDLKFLVYIVYSSTGQRPASYCHGVVSVMHPSVCASVNSSLKKLLRNY